MHTHVVRFHIDLTLPEAEDEILAIRTTAVLLGGTVGVFPFIDTASVLVRVDKKGHDWFVENKSPTYAGLA